MTRPAYALFETAFGHAGFAWGPAGLIAVAFPAPAASTARARLLAKAREASQAPPEGGYAALRDAIIRLLSDGRTALPDVPLDESGLSEFERAVYARTRAIPAGAVARYGEIARALGDPTRARAVGSALGRNPHPIVTPCHRVIGESGAMTGFSAPGGVETKRRLLALEGALPKDLFD